MARKSNKRRTDPTVARDKVRGAARSAFGFVARLLGAAVVVAGTFAAVIATYLWMTTSSRFAVREVDIAGNHHATLAELAPLTGLAQGTNLFLVNADEVAARLESHPWVRTAVVRRVFPSTVQVTVDEHHAVALVALGGLYLADAEGQVFKRAVPGDPMGLPVITGLKRGEGEAGRAALEAGVRQALTVARDWRHSPMAKVARLSEIHLDPLAGVSLTAAGDAGDGKPMVVHLGHHDLVRRLLRLHQLWTTLSARGQRPQEVFLDNHTRPQWVVARVD